MNREEILKCLKVSKENYILDTIEGDGLNRGMCYHIWAYIEDYTGRDIPYEQLKRYIPEFTYEFSGSARGTNSNSTRAYWWPCKERKPRIKFFDKLIKIYSEDIEDNG